MKAIILAGGFGTRLLPLTRYMPKAMLPVAGKPIIDYQIEQLASVGGIDQIVVSTNAYFKNNFHHWWLRLPPRFRDITSLVVEPSLKEGEKFGSVRGLQYVIGKESLFGNELLVLAGDNLFGFQLSDLITFYRQNNCATVAFCHMECKEKVKDKYGVGILNHDDKLIEFEEKPHNPRSVCASTGCYIFPASLNDDLQKYISQTANLDALGHFIRWLCPRTSVYGFVFKGGWYDIGSFDSYVEANNYYADRLDIKVGV